MANTRISTLVGARMPNELYVELVRIARLERRSVSWVLKEAAAEYVRKQQAKAAKKRKTP
jgi:predicted transcriptional regulator